MGIFIKSDETVKRIHSPRRHKMVTKSTVNVIAGSVLLALAGNVAAECVLQETTVSTSGSTITARDNIKRTIVEEGPAYTCSVRFRAQIKGEWHTTTGEYTYGNTDHDGGCALAIKDGDRNLINQLNSEVQSKQILVCHDDESQMNIDKTAKGTTGYLSQFRAHPNYGGTFRHQGAQCRWFLDQTFTTDLETYEGIICNLSGDQWTVVDKF